jgi:hypothetical protein
MKKVIIFSLMLILLISSVSAITISPAVIEANFEPGLETVLAFHVDSKLDRNLELYVAGDFIECVELSKKSVYKSGDFTAHIKLPDSVDIPGKKRIYIGAREVIDEELRGGLAVTAAVQAVVVVYVPYPGKYIESKVFASYVNINEPVEFGLDIYSRGKEQVTVQPRIEIYSESNELIDTLYFQEREMNKDDQLKLEKIWDTTGRNAGTYRTVSIIDYDDNMQSRSEAEFRIGDLTINITNYSQEIEIEDMRPFIIELESGWNNQIDGVYAEVVIYNQTNRNVANFITTPTSLTPWQRKEIVGYFNTSNMEQGEYTASMNVFYFGAGTNKTASKIGTVKFVYPKEEEIVNYYLITSILLGIILFILIFFWIISKLFNVKNVKKKK